MPNLKVIFAIKLILLITVLIPMSAWTADIPIEDRALQTAIVLNYCQMSLVTIASYNDRIVLDEQYNEIINNIDLTKIDDKEVITLLTGLMGTISKFRLTEGDKDLVQKEYNRQVRTALYDNISQIANGAISGAMSGNYIVEACNTLIGVGSAYANYKINMELYRSSLESKTWQLEKEDITELNILRMTFLKNSWDLMKRYNIPDEYRLTEDRMTAYIETIKSKDAAHRLRQFKRMEDWFKAYPPYYYFLGAAQQELKHNNEALRSYDIMDRLNMNFFRNDTLYTSTLMNRIQMADPKLNREGISNSLRAIIKQNPLDGRKNFYAGLWYMQLGEYEEARRRFEASIDNKFNETQSKKMLTLAYQKKNDKGSISNLIDEMVRDNNVKNHEVLYVLGKLPEIEIIKKMKDQIFGIYPSFDKDEVRLTLPDKWVLSDFSNFYVVASFREKKFRPYKFALDKEKRLITYYFKKMLDQKQFLKIGKNEQISFILADSSFPVTVTMELVKGSKEAKKDFYDRVKDTIWRRNKSKDTKQIECIQYRMLKIETKEQCYSIAGGKNIEFCR